MHTWTADLYSLENTPHDSITVNANNYAQALDCALHIFGKDPQDCDSQGYCLDGWRVDLDSATG